MRLQLSSGRKRILVSLEPRERVWWLQMSFPLARGANSAPPNFLAGFDGPLRSGTKRVKREGTDNRGEEKGRKGTGENTPEINFLLRFWAVTTIGDDDDDDDDVACEVGR